MFYLMHNTKILILLSFVLFLFGSLFLRGQDASKPIDNESIVENKILLPVAVPVLTPEEAQKANEEAVKEYKDELRQIRNKKIKLAIKRAEKPALFLVVFIIFGALVIVFRKQVRRFLLFFYQTPFGRLFYSRSFCQWDWLAIALVFGITFLFSILAGQKAMLNDYIGTWYARDAGPVAISLYNTGKAKKIVYEAGSKLDGFLRKGNLGSKDFSSITNEEAIPQEYTDETSFIESTGIAWLMAFWWKLIGYPDWSTLYILFSLFYSLTAVAAYCALRQVTGLIPSILLGLLLSAYPSMMHMGLFIFRDGARALFCFIAIAILLYQLRGIFTWKGTVICSIFLFLICALSTYFRQDFIVLIPFILIAAIFFHGKILADYKKKLTIFFSIVAGLIVSFNLPGTRVDYGMGHVLYIGMADHPYMDDLYYSADNYSKGIAYSDVYCFMCASGKAYRDHGVINLKLFSKEYDQVCRKEIYSLFAMYPYDFINMALSSAIQSLNIGSRYAESKPKWIVTAPGYHLFQKQSKNLFLNLPYWIFFINFLALLLLFLGSKFYHNLFLCLAFMPMCAVYMLQYGFRHYFYLLILSLLIAGFLFNRAIRISIISIKNWKRVWSICCQKRKDFLIHCSIFAGLLIFAILVLFIAKTIQTIQINAEINNLNVAKAEAIQFDKKTVSSSIKRNVSGTELVLPTFYNDILKQSNTNQLTFNEFLKIKFKVLDADLGKKINVFAKYENTSKYGILPLGMSSIINSTWTCPIRLTFSPGEGVNTLFVPVYFTRKGPKRLDQDTFLLFPRTSSPLIGIEFEADGKTIEFESVERIVDTQKIHTQSAFLVPERMDAMKFTGNIDWKKVFWGNK